MKPITTDFTLTMPSELKPLSASSSCTFTIKVYTVNRQNHYSVSFSGVPATVRIPSQSMMSMDTGVVNFDWYVSEIDPSMPDGTYDTEGHCTSDYFWIKQSTDDLLASLTERVSHAENEASAAYDYASSAYTFADDALDMASSALSAASATSDELDAFEGEILTALGTKQDASAFTQFVENSAITRNNFEETMTGSHSWDVLNDKVSGNTQNIRTLSGQVSANTSNIASLSGAMSGKQDTLIAGSGIGINNNVISVTASIPTGDFVTTGDFNSFVENSAVTKSNFEGVLEESQGWDMHETAIGLLSGDVATLSGAISGNTSNIATLSGQVSANTASIANKQNARLEGVITEDENVYTINQSFRNLYQTYLNGGDILAQKGASPNIYQLSHIANDGMMFSYSDAKQGIIEEFELTSGDVLTRTVYDIPTKLQGKQDTLIAGTGIMLQNNVISVTGGSEPTSGYVTREDFEDSELVTAAALNDLNKRVNDVSASTSAITSLSADVQTLSGEVTANTSDISTLSGNVSTLSGQVSTNTSNITSISGQIGDIATALSNIVGE